MEQTKTIPDLVVVKHQEGRTSEPEVGLKRRLLAYNEKLFLVEHEMVKGWVGTLHSHAHDQMVYIVHGHLKVTCDGKNFSDSNGRHLCGAGQSGAWRVCTGRIARH